MLSPEDKKLLLDFAGPIFQESKEIDGMYYNDARPKVNGYVDGGIAEGIKDALERGLRQPQGHPAPAPQQDYSYLQPPALPEQAVMQQHFPQHQVMAQPAYPRDDSQLEFNFNVTEQQKTNELLEKQNKLLTELNSTISKLVDIFEKIKDDE
jgi:hypothetical protein